MRQLTFIQASGNVSWTVDVNCTLLMVLSNGSGVLTKDPNSAATDFSAAGSNSLTDKFAIFLANGIPVNLYLLPTPVQLAKGETVVYSSSLATKSSATIFIDP